MVKCKFAPHKRLIDYCSSSTVHGLAYITEPGVHISERLVWLGLCGAAGWATILLLQASWVNFQEHAVSFAVDTAYLQWNTSFPAVSVCEYESPDKIYDAASNIWGGERNLNLDVFLRDIVFYDGTCGSCKSHCAGAIDCSQDFIYLINRTRSSCDSLLDSCSWNGVPFDCCSQFLPQATEMGTCFSLTSIQARRGLQDQQFISNRLTGPGRLKFKAYEAIRLLIHGTEEVPYINHPQEEKVVLSWGSQLHLIFHVTEIDNADGVAGTSVGQRRCMFPREGSLGLYPFYSYSACIVACRAKAQLRLCGCNHHFIPPRPGVKVCDIKGLICLAENAETLRTLKTKENKKKKGLVCDCISSCTEPDFNVISKTVSERTEVDPDEKMGSVIEVEMGALPSLRFRREIVRSTLDLVVSMGGTTGLFLGASLLSGAELLYWLFLRRRVVKETSRGGHQVIRKPLLLRTGHKHRAGPIVPYIF